jgi:hypothetical protein
MGVGTHTLPQQPSEQDPGSKGASFVGCGVQKRKATFTLGLGVTKPLAESHAGLLGSAGDRRVTLLSIQGVVMRK